MKNNKNILRNKRLQHNKTKKKNKNKSYQIYLICHTFT